MSNLSTITTFNISNTHDADEELDTFLSHPHCRSIEQLQKRASIMIKDADIKEYFLSEGKKRLEKIPSI